MTVSARTTRGVDVDDRLGEHDLAVLRTLALIRTASREQLARLHFPMSSTRAPQRCSPASADTDWLLVSHVVSAV